MDGLAEKLKNEKNIDIPSDKRFVGLDAYKQVIDSDIDVLIDCTPPFFRAEHFKYAVEKKQTLLSREANMCRFCWLSYNSGSG